MSKFDKLLIFFLIIASLGILIVKKISFSNKDDKYIMVYIDNSRTRKVNLYKKKDYDIISDSKAYFKIRVENQKVRVLNSSCKEKVCIHLGFIENINDSIICAPNRIVVVIESFKDTSKAIDVISY